MADNGFEEHKRVIIYRLDTQEKLINQIILTLNTFRDELAEFRGKSKILTVLISIGTAGLMSLLVSVAIKIFG